MNEYRLVYRLITYWDTIKKENPFPNFSHFNASALADVWQQCVLLSLQPMIAGKLPVLSFQMVGDNLVSIYGKDALGKTFNPTHRSFQGAKVVSRVGELIANPAPIIDMGQFVSEQGKIVKYRSCLLPFGRQGIVTHVVAGLSWREF